MNAKSRPMTQKRFRRKRHNRKKHPTTKSLNKKIHHIENTLMELKFIDVFNAGSVIPVAGTQDYLLPIAQGDTASTRTGSIINPTSVQVRMAIQTDIDQNSDSRVRAILFWDRQANNAAPTLTGVSASLSLLDTSVVTDTTLSPINFNNIERYHVLWDKLFVFNPLTNLTVVAGATTQVVQQEQIKVLYRKLGRMVKYNGTGATIASLGTNSLFMAYFTDVAVAANQPSVIAGYRVYFRDS